MPTVSPKLSTPTSDATRKRLVAAGAAAKRADTELREAVLEALAEGASIREVAELAGISTNTVQRWKQGANASIESVRALGAALRKMQR